MTTVIEQDKKTTSSSPKLTCVVTGRTRPSNTKYLADKAQAKGVEVDEFVSHYTCKQAVKRLRAGQSIEEVRNDIGTEVTTPISDETVKMIIRLNGKNKS